MMRTFPAPLLMIVPIIALSMMLATMRPVGSYRSPSEEKAADKELCDREKYSVVTDGTWFRVQWPSGYVASERFPTRQAAEKDIDFAARYFTQIYHDRYEAEWKKADQ